MNDEQSARRTVRYGSYAVALIMILNVISVILNLYDGQKERALFLTVIVALYFAAGYLMYKKISRVGCIIALTLIIIETTFFLLGGGSTGGRLFKLLLVLFLIGATRAAFAYHRLSEDSPDAADKKDPRTKINFFERQVIAKRRTSILIPFFIFAVLCMIAGAYTAVVFSMTVINKSGSATGFWQPMTFLWVSLGVLGIIALGSLIKIISLRKGGQSVAEMLGGIPVDRHNDDHGQTRLLNVVEEMAIASGVPVPHVYLLAGEPGINALAAGFSPANAVIVVTQGCVKELLRDELQGVIAHEFSHILNNDIRLNTWLVGIIAGLLIGYMTGREIIRACGLFVVGTLKAGFKSPITALIIILCPLFIALLLFLVVVLPLIVGIIITVPAVMGVFFGRLIKSAVSRQREFLADASAVQFTRNPAGLIGALKKIASGKTGSRVLNIHAEEASHLFFGNGLKKSFFGPFSTHPPVQERIRRLQQYVPLEIKKDLSWL